MFFKRQNPYALVVAMTGVKMGDRLLQVGCGSGSRLGAIAAKVGLSGRAVAIVPDEDSAARARAGAGAGGVLRVGGRVVVIGTAPRSGLGAVFTRATAGPPYVSSGDAVKSLQADGFPAARLLAERDGLAFAEGLKGR